MRPRPHFAPLWWQIYEMAWLKTERFRWEVSYRDTVGSCKIIILADFTFGIRINDDMPELSWFYRYDFIRYYLNLDLTGNAMVLSSSRLSKLGFKTNLKNAEIVQNYYITCEMFPLRLSPLSVSLSPPPSLNLHRFPATFYPRPQPLIKYPFVQSRSSWCVIDTGTKPALTMTFASSSIDVNFCFLQ